MLFACVISHCWRQAAGLQEPLVWHDTAVPPLWTYIFCMVGAERSSRLQAVSARGNTSAWIRLCPIAGCACSSGRDIVVKMRLGRDSNLGISSWVQTLACTPHISALKNVGFSLKSTFHTQKMEIWHNTLSARIAEILWFCPNIDWELIRKLWKFFPKHNCFPLVIYHGSLTPEIHKYVQKYKDVYQQFVNASGKQWHRKTMAQSILHRSHSMAMVGSWSSEKCSNTPFPMLREEMPEAKDTGSACGGSWRRGLGCQPQKEASMIKKNTTER